MRKDECAREMDVLDALQTSAWPDCCATDLRAHVAACASCAELVEIVQPLLDAHRTAVVEAPVPSSGIVWWRAQMRARQEAARAAAAPIRIAQKLSVACAVGLLAGASSLVSPAVRQWLGWLGTRATEGAAVSWTGIISTELAPGAMAVPAVAGVAMLLILAPLALYLSAPEK